MKKIRIKDFIFFNNLFGKECYYYFRLNNSEIISREVLKSEYGFDDLLLANTWELRYSYDIIPVFSVDNEKIMREYLGNMKNKEIDRILKNMTYDELNLWFERRWEIERSFSDWDSYHDMKIIESAVEWCDENNIPYTKGDVYEHN